jgi:hypothetical protein
MLFFNGEASSPILVADLSPHEYENKNLNYRKTKLKRSCEFLSPGLSFFLNAKRSIYRLREVLEALVNLDNLEVSLPVKIEV